MPLVCVPSRDALDPCVQNFHRYNFPVIMWACLKLARPLNVMIVDHCAATVRAYGWQKSTVIKCAVQAAVAVLYLWFFVQLSTTVKRFLLLLLG